MTFSIDGIVNDVGEEFTISGVTKTFNDWGDPTETYTGYTISGVVQVMDGSEDEVKDGLLDREDIILFIDADTGNVDQVRKENHVTITTTTSGVFRIVNVIRNAGHIEAYAKRIVSL